MNTTWSQSGIRFTAKDPQKKIPQKWILEAYLQQKQLNVRKMTGVKVSGTWIYDLVKFATLFVASKTLAHEGGVTPVLLKCD